MLNQLLGQSEVEVIVLMILGKVDVSNFIFNLALTNNNRINWAAPGFSI